MRLPDLRPGNSIQFDTAFEDRPYTWIRPSTTAVDRSATAQAFRRLHHLLTETTTDGLVAGATPASDQSVVEFQLAADGRADAELRWLVHAPVPEVHSEVTDLLRTGLPTTYEFTDRNWHPRRLEAALPTVRETHTVERTGTRIETGVAPYVAGVEYYATTERKRDWQTGLTPVDAGNRSAGAGRHERPGESHTVPLAALVERLTQSDLPALFQVVLRPYPDWSRQQRHYLTQLSNGTAGPLDGVLEGLSPGSGDEPRAETPDPGDRHRITAIEHRDPANCFVVSARAVVLTREDPAEADAIARSLARALGGLGGRFHSIGGRVVTDGDPRWLDHRRPGLQVYRDLISGHLQPVRYEARRRNLPFRTRYSTGIVADPGEVPGFCLLDGAGLTADGQRAIAARRRERTGLSLPPAHQLAEYTPPGMELCRPLTHDRDPHETPLALPPAVQDRHVVVTGATGAGKSVLLERAVLSNATATAGPDILLDYKGGSTGEDYLRTHYAEHGTLENVYYFDLSETLPALSFFDIGPLLEVGIPREEARSRTAGHYEEILAGVLGPEQYGQAAESVKAVRNHVRALFDPVHGADAFPHEDLYAALRRTHREQDPPATADDSLAAYFDELRFRDRDVFNAILGGAVGRVETIATDGRLAPVFDHVPEADDPQLAFDELLDEDVTIVFDFAGLEANVKRALTLVILSDLWTALTARERTGGSDGPLVNLYLEEARDVADTRLLDTLLAEGRSFGLSVTIGVQYPEQLESPEPERKTYQELLNETATFVAGRVAVDTDLPRVLATDANDPAAVARQLNNLGRGEWLVRPGTGFGEDPISPFRARSLAPPAGHPASDAPLEGDTARQFSEAFDRCRRRTADRLGIDHESIDATAEETIAADVRLDSLLPHSDRLPDQIDYHAGRHALHCDTCESRYAPTSEGMRDALECCGSLDDIERADIPVCRLELKRSPAEIESAEWSLTQLSFLQVVYNAQQRRYDPLEYDLVRDSMRLLKRYVGIDNEAVEALTEAGLLKRDTEHPHLLYTVTPDGREAIGESHRAGVDFGHGQGDLWESTTHVFGVELGQRWLEQTHVPADDSRVEETHPYFDLRRTVVDEADDIEDDAPRADDRRLDLAGLDGAGDVAVAVEVERINDGVRRSVPADYDKLAACDADEAIWIVPTQDAGQAVFNALRDPLDGQPRVGRFHPRLNTPPSEHEREEPGLTAIYTYAWLQERLEFE